MEFKIRRLFLLSLLEKAWSAGVGGLLPTTKGFYFAKVDDSLRVVRTDSKMGAIATTNALTWVDDVAPMEFLVDADKMLKLMKTLDCEEVVLRTKPDGTLVIEGGNFSAAWKLFDLKDFPTLPSYEEVGVIIVNTSEFISAVERVKFFTSAEALSPAYKQIYFEDKKCWASDGYNYQEVKTEISLPEVLSIPLVSIDVLRFLKLSGQKTFDLSWDDNFIYFNAGSSRFLCTRSHVAPPSSFTDFFSKMALDAHKEPHFTFSVSQLRSVVERVAITGSATQKKVTFFIKPLALYVKGVDDDGNSSEEVLTITLSGRKIEGGLGIHYEAFLKALQSIAEKSAVLFVDKSFVRIKSEDSLAVLPLLKK